MCIGITCSTFSEAATQSALIHLSEYHSGCFFRLLRFNRHLLNVFCKWTFTLFRRTSAGIWQAISLVDLSRESQSNALLVRWKRAKFNHRIFAVWKSNCLSCWTSTRLTAGESPVSKTNQSKRQKVFFSLFDNCTVRTMRVELNEYSLRQKSPFRPNWNN